MSPDGLYWLVNGPLIIGASIYCGVLWILDRRERLRVAKNRQWLYDRILKNHGIDAAIDYWAKSRRRGS